MTRKVLLVAKVLHAIGVTVDLAEKRRLSAARKRGLLIKDCFVFNLPSWKQHFPGEFIKG